MLTLWSEEVPHFAGIVQEATTAHETQETLLQPEVQGNLQPLMCITKDTNFLGAAKTRRESNYH